MMSRALHWTVGAKFFLILGVLGVALVHIAVIALVGFHRTEDQADQLLAHSVRVGDQVDLLLAVDGVGRTAVRLTGGAGETEQVLLNARLDEILIPAVQSAMGALRANTDEQSAEQLDRVAVDFSSYLRLRASGDGVDLAARVAELFDQTAVDMRSMVATEQATAAGLHEESATEYRHARTLTWTSLGLALTIGLLAVMLLIRNLVPRIRDYSHFAAEVAAGRPVGKLEPRGHDELADLGRALVHMTETNARRASSDASQAEFVDTVQVTMNEDEAHELLRRHIERSVPGSTTVVLQRNNSANRLQSATALEPDSPLAQRLIGSEPRSCLALRFGRTHHEGLATAPLLGCDVCSMPEGRSTCEPLLVGGEVIGSVLVRHDEPIDEEGDRRIKNTVSQAAPILANLRNLALAEFRANNDSLTGLPNRRATDDTLKRMVAQANRSISPLAAVMLDLDHFKQINDHFGHAKGDAVLAAVGATLQATLRAGDFAGRFGGEEFLLLLPDTTLDGAFEAAEKVRTAIAATTIPGVDRAITASLGLADLMQHAGNAERLVREADRALYAAKTAGRNRTVVASNDSTVPDETPATRPGDAENVIV